MLLSLGIICLPAWSILHLYEPSEEPLSMLIWSCSPNTNFHYRLSSSYLVYVVCVNFFFYRVMLLLFLFMACLWHCSLPVISNKYVSGYASPNCCLLCNIDTASVFWHCWLDCSKGMCHVKMLSIDMQTLVILEVGLDGLHMFQRYIWHQCHFFISCCIVSRNSLTFW